MGTWGTGPFESDDAADIYAGIEKVLMKPVRSLLRKTERAGKQPSRRFEAEYDYQSARAAIATMVVAFNAGGFATKESLDDSEKALRVILGNQGFVGSFKNPKKAKKQLEKELDDLLKTKKLFAISSPWG